jgi:hypothetical protein
MEYKINSVHFVMNAILSFDNQVNNLFDDKFSYYTAIRC